MALTATNNPSGFSTAVRDWWLSSNYMSLFTERSPFFKMLAMKGQIKGSGFGNRMREPLMVPVDTGPQLVGVENPYATNDAQPMTGFTEAHYDLSEYVIPVSWELYQEMRAGGDVEMVNWVQAIYQNAIVRSNEKLKNDLWAPPENIYSAGTRKQIASIRTFVNAGTTAATGANILPIQANQSAVPVVGTTGSTAITIVGDIQRAAAGAAYWCPSVFNGSPYSPGATALTIQSLNDLYEEAYQDGDAPDLILAPSQLYSKLQNLLVVGGGNGGTFLQPGDTARFGFDHLYFRGALIVVDRRVPTAGFLSGTSTAIGNHMFCLNLDHIKLRMKSNKPTFREVPTTQQIHQEVGAIYMCLTADHLGNVHSLGYNFTA